MQGMDHGPMTTEELYRQYAGFVTRFLVRLSVPAEHLEDALQEVFLVVHRNGGYRPGLAKPTSYLANMAIHAAAKHRQRQATMLKRHALEPVELIPSDSQDLGHSLQVRRDLKRLQDALQELPEELRTTLLLVEMEGESCVSVAAGLNCPVGTIYSRLHTARKRLQAALRARAPRSRQPSEGPNQPPLPSRSWMMMIGFSDFRGSEAARLLRLAREQPEPPLPIEDLLVRLRELQSAGTLPSWASGYAPPTTTWLGVLGAPAAASLTAAMVAVGAVLFARSAPIPQPPAAEPSFEHVASAHTPTAAPPAAVSTETVDTAAPPRDAIPARAEPAPERTSSRRRRAQALRARSALTPRPRGPQRALTASAATPNASEPIAPGGQTSAATLPPQNAESQPKEAAPQTPEPKPEPPVQAEPVAREPAPARIDPVLAEIRTIEEAEHTLATDPSRTLELTRAMQARFADGNLREERAYLELMALHKLGRAEEVRQKANRFLRCYPAGIYSARVRKVAGAEDK